MVTAYYTHDGHLVIDHAIIERRYLRGWFGIDVISCLPFGYISYVVESNMVCL
jgi:hypothetical protein